MLQVCTLASGSSGNCTLVSDGTTHILIDAGISARRIGKSLAVFGLAPADLSAIFITHEHSDHIAGVATLTKHFAIPIYASAGTARQLTYRILFPDEVLHCFSPGSDITVRSLHLTSFSTPHDAAQSVGYTVTDGKRKAALVTDLGHITPSVRAALKGAHLVIAEANHDVEMLRMGEYPPFLKKRILGDEGHLSNEAGACLVGDCVEAGAQTILLAHLSSENNTPRCAYDTVAEFLRARGVCVERDITLKVAPRAQPDLMCTV